WNEFDRIELHNENWINVMDELAFGQTVGSWDKFDNNELYNKGSTSVIDESAVGQTDVSWNEIDLIELYNEDSTNVTNELAIRQIVDSQDKLDHIELHDENLANRMDEPVVEQIFGCWNKLDHFISFYAQSQNFVSIICGSEYSDGICRSCRYAFRASCPKTTSILKINSVCLNYNDHQIRNETNKFALKYRTFSKDMLKDIKFWTKIGNINIRTQYQMLVKQYPDIFFLSQDLSNVIQSFKQQNSVEYKAATLLNDLLERKSKDSSWIVRQALINDETVESYEWVFQTLIANTNVAPLTLITDNDLAVNAAHKLLSKFPDAVLYLNRALNNEKSQNAIIKTSVNSAISLINLEKHINEQINRELGLQFDQSNLTEQTEQTEQSDSDEGFNGFVEDCVDAPATLIKELIPSTKVDSIHEVWEVTRHRRNTKNYIVLFKDNSHLCTCLNLIQCRHFFNVMTTFNYAAFHIMLISRRWYTDKKQIELESETRKHPFIIGLGRTETSISIEQTFSNLLFQLPDISFSDIHAKVNHRKAYVTVNGLSKKAIQIGLDAGNHAIQELENFMNGFINKYAPKRKEKVIQKRNIRQHEYEDEATGSSSSDKENAIIVENLLVNSKRGAPRKKRFKGSNEPEKKHVSGTKQWLEIQKAKKQTQCQQCQNTGHNRASCKAWHK
ncbi:16826_t:CDS:10, partial [Gigaspora margarita]